MSAAPASPLRHLLLYEPRTEGHHISWLQFITEDLLSAGLRLTLAVDRRPKGEAKLRAHLGGLLDQVTLMDALAAPRGAGGYQLPAVRHCLKTSGAQEVFLCELDEIASDLWRRACFGIRPAPELRGRLSGIYHRPRFLGAPRWSPQRWVKQIGFGRLLRAGWFRHLLLVDEFLAPALQAQFPQVPFAALPVPSREFQLAPLAEARRALGVPLAPHVFLFYGGGYRRKGLHLAVAAMRALPPEVPAFLLCVGQLNPTGDVARGLAELTAQNRALLINRYVSDAEEALAYAASDTVLLPYLRHFGGSAILSQAATAARMVIASDEQLLGRLVRDHNLGLRFVTDNSADLARALREAVALPDDERAGYTARARQYAAACSRAAYRRVLLQAVLGSAPGSPRHG